MRPRTAGFATHWVAPFLVAAMGACSDEDAATVNADAGVDDLGACPAPPASRLRLLTRFEYDNTIQDLLGDSTRRASDFPREALVGGLDNDSSANAVNADGLTQYLEVAERLAKAAAQSPAGQGCLNRTCLTQLTDVFGRSVFRRKLEPAERTIFEEVFEQAAAASGPTSAFEQTVTALLQSPQFLYRDEWGFAKAGTTNLSLSGPQVAAKLSYFIQATTPDATLLRAAEQGKLDTSLGIASQATTLVMGPRGMAGLARYLALWLSLDGVENTEKDVVAFPGFSRELSRSWRTSLELFINETLTTEHTLRALLKSPSVYVDDKMLALDYALSGTVPPGEGFRKVLLPAQQAAGILGQPGFLAFKGLHDGSSPIRRGIFVLDKLLCEPPPPPPGDVAIVPPAPSTSATTRERFANHRSDPTCAACHSLIDPVGYTFENYDGMGRWRDTENGQPINAKGGFTDATEASLVGEVEGVPALVEKLLASPQVHQCVAREVYRYAMGRQLTEADLCWLKPISERFLTSGGDFRELLLGIATSPAFRTHAPVTIEDAK